jgi:hypothetical protein
MYCGGGHLEFSIGIKKQKFGKGPSNDHSWKFKMAATVGLSLTLDPTLYGKNVSKRFFSEATRTVETKLPRNDHWRVLSQIFVFLCRSKIQDGRHRNT